MVRNSEGGEGMVGNDEGERGGRQWRTGVVGRKEGGKKC